MLLLAALNLGHGASAADVAASDCSGPGLRIACPLPADYASNAEAAISSINALDGPKLEDMIDAKIAASDCAGATELAERNARLDLLDKITASCR